MALEEFSGPVTCSIPHVLPHEASVPVIFAVPLRATPQLLLELLVAPVLVNDPLRQNSPLIHW